VYELVKGLPKFYSWFDFIESSWNWDGKFLGIVWGIICFFLFRKYFVGNDFFRLKQDKQNFKKVLIASTIIVILSTFIWALFGKSDFDIETLAFQLTVPGIDEEILFRGILLGLLMSSLKDRLLVLGNPSIVIIAVLFGLMHALTLDKSFIVHFDPIYFLQTGFAGYIWSWITIKSRSILFAILSHNFSNFLGTLATMIG
jgi:membrane protease YdiL (CAAX protease family)